MLTKYLKKAALPLLVLFFPLLAFAADAPDFAGSILAIWTAIQSHAGTALILVPVFQFLRTNEVVGILSKISGKYLQVVIAVLTVLGFVVDAWAKGQGLGAAAIAGLFTSGGAMLIFEAIKSIKSS